MKFSPLILLALAAEAFAESIRGRLLIDSVYRSVSALASQPLTKDDTMNAAQTAALEKLHATDAYLKRLVLLLPTVHALLTDLQGKVKGAADDKKELEARLAATLGELATAKTDLDQFTGIATTIGATMTAADKADDQIERDTGAGPSLEAELSDALAAFNAAGGPAAGITLTFNQLQHLRAHGLVTQDGPEVLPFVAGLPVTLDDSQVETYVFTLAPITDPGTGEGNADGTPTSTTPPVEGSPPDSTTPPGESGTVPDPNAGAGTAVPTPAGGDAGTPPAVPSSGDTGATDPGNTPPASDGSPAAAAGTDPAK